MPESCSSRPNKSTLLSMGFTCYSNDHTVRRLTNSFANISFNYEPPFTQASEEQPIAPHVVAQPVSFPGKLTIFTYSFYSYHW
jgi:hypothetical protein